jgi:3-oxoacyl-(acyl-carrier-protein) synthase
MGVVSPVGTGIDGFWSSLCRGVYGIGPLTRIDVSKFDLRHGAEVKDFVCPDSLKAAAAGADLATQFALVAAAEAMRNAEFESAGVPREEIAVVLATNFGGVASLEGFLGREATAEQLAPALREYGFQQAVNRLADHWDLRGPRVALSLSCASGTAVIGYGMDLIRAGRARMAVVGGYDALSLFCWSGLCGLRTMTKDRIRPFDKNRSGTIFGEGAGVLILEDWDHALRRGAPIAGEVCGHGMNNNAYHMTAPDAGGGGLRLAMEMALEDARIAPEEIDHVNAHGTGTKFNDVTETQAIKAVLGSRACRIPINSIKSMTGHTMGACGGLEAIASLLSLRDGIIPPTINLQTPDPDCDLDYTPNQARQMPIRTVLSNSAGIGGCNAAVVLRKVS